MHHTLLDSVILPHENSRSTLEIRAKLFEGLYALDARARLQRIAAQSRWRLLRGAPCQMGKKGGLALKQREHVGVETTAGLGSAGRISQGQLHLPPRLEASWQERRIDVRWTSSRGRPAAFVPVHAAVGWRSAASVELCAICASKGQHAGESSVDAWAAHAGHGSQGREV